MRLFKLLLDLLKSSLMIQLDDIFDTLESVWRKFLTIVSTAPALNDGAGRPKSPHTICYHYLANRLADWRQISTELTRAVKTDAQDS